jgi:NADH:ubiquinone oxidoreductase subunit 5 (subunit L)/multisubunit Na+/H+ antiporter MnhA subunit
MFYLLRTFSQVFLGEVKTPGHEGTRSMVAVVAILAVLSLMAGLLITYPATLAEVTTAHIMGWLK